MDIGSAAFFANPYPTYEILREVIGPYWIERSDGRGSAWLVAGYDDVASILKEARVSKDAGRVIQKEWLGPLNKTIQATDPPEHTRLRGLIGQAFTPARIKSLEVRIGEIVDELIAGVRADGCMDFIAAFAKPLPMRVTCELLGIPAEEWATFAALSDQAVRVTTSAAVQDDRLRSQKSLAALQDYFASLLRDRRERLGSDLISALMTVHDADDRLTEDELVRTCMLLLIASFETTTDLLGNGMLTLLSHPEQHQLLKLHPEIMPLAVEEMLRYESPAQRGTFRCAREPISLNSCTILPDQQIEVLLGAANRDPRQFPAPDRFDITRKPNRHLAFGAGIHICLGAMLARTEARIAFTRLLQALPRMHLIPQAPEWKREFFFRSLQALPVAF